jgi:hypothetical protein
MSAPTANRYTCRDCGKTYRSFRSEEEWRAAHLLDVCPAHVEAEPDVPLSGPVAAANFEPQPATVQVTERPAPAKTAWWHKEVFSIAAVLLTTLVLFGVALDAVNTLSDAANAGPRAATVLLAALIAGPCVYAVYHLLRALPDPETQGTDG